ncbi:hypothetical protein CTAYLR_003881 [Chrysophaeum taylorii]|uniref:Major facilitator superfamily associated domain-containing protein n=1 Tax=Chrysophaeum taylorii TaxID=2483200 RepID=A0AAD7UM74_9STRA|nr:hypothetical protein CTAYLR_003881 [Chrysophaeum taylorii]
MKRLAAPCRRLLSSSSSSESQKFTVSRAEVKSYKAKLRELRRQWRAEEAERRASTSLEKSAERERVKIAKAARKAAKRERALANLEKQKEVQAEAKLATEARVKAAVGFVQNDRRKRVDRQRRLVAALEAESATWLTTDDLVDEKITDVLWEAPASTGLVTDHSHYFWRYIAEVERFDFNPPDLSVLTPTAASRERQRVATLTERLIRTHSVDLNEYHKVLDDASEIAEAIKDLKPQHQEPRFFGTMRLPFFDDASEEALLRSKAVAKRRPLILGKLLMFATWAQSASVLAYIAIALWRQRFSVWSIGVLLSLCMSAQTVCSMAATTVADAIGAHKALAVGSHALSVAAIGAAVLLSDERTMAERCLLVAAFSFASMTRPIVDAAILCVIENLESFGEQRAWGNVGSGVGALCYGATLSGLASRGVRQIVGGSRAPLGAYVLLAPVTLALIAALPMNGLRRRSPSFSAGAATALFNDPAVIGVLGVVFLMGILFAVLVQYVFLWAWQQRLAGSWTTIVVGAAAAATNLCEIPIVFYASTIAERVGVHGVLRISGAAYLARIAVYVAMAARYEASGRVSAWWLLVAEPAQALTFSLTVSITAAHMRNLAAAILPPDVQGSALAQGLTQGTSALGRAIGFLAGAALLETQGALPMFVATEAVALFLVFVGLPLFESLHHTTGGRRHLLDVDNLDRPPVHPPPRGADQPHRTPSIYF